MTYKAVIQTSTGHALRAGYCNFEEDGSFNPEKETIVEANFPCRVKPRRRLADGEATRQFTFDVYNDGWTTTTINA